MAELELRTTPRETIGKQVKQLRREGLVPGILYGRGIESIAVKIDQQAAEDIVRQAGSSTLVKVHVEGQQEPFSVIVRDVQRHVIRRDLLHVDLQALSMTETVRLPIPVVLVGNAPAAEELGGVLLQQINEIEVECLPGALVSAFEIDVSGMTEIGDAIAIKDMDIPAGIEILSDPEETVVMITFIEEEVVEEEETFEVIGELEEVEVIGRGADEEGEFEEGEEEAE
ncbi:MAG: 50S ribosomal protein L25 [Anaerolineales bacterium]